MGDRLLVFRFGIIFIPQFVIGYIIIVLIYIIADIYIIIFILGTIRFKIFISCFKFILGIIRKPSS